MGVFGPDPEKNVNPEFLWNQDKPDPRAPQKQPLAYISPMLRLPISDAFGITFFSMQMLIIRHKKRLPSRISISYDSLF